jgi:hypothetical protein
MRYLFWLCAVLVVVTGAMSTNLWRALRAEREQTVALQTQIDAATVRERVLAETPLPVAPPPAPVAAVPDKPAPEPAAKPQSATPARVVPGGVDFGMQQRELWKDPEYRKARLAQIRAQVGRNYPGLAEDLGLSPAEESHLLDVLAEAELNTNATFSTLSSSANDPETSKQISARLTETMRQRDDAVIAALGPDGKARWDEYQQTAAGRSQANSYNTMLAQAGMPLSATQLKSLSTVVVAEQKRQRDEMTALTRNINPQDPTAIAQIEPELRRRQNDYNERVLAAAAPIMSAQQIQLLRTQFEQQNAMNRAMERARAQALAAQPQQGAQ